MPNQAPRIFRELGTPLSFDAHAAPPLAPQIPSRKGKVTPQEPTNSKRTLRLELHREMKDPFFQSAAPAQAPEAEQAPGQGEKPTVHDVQL